MNKGDKWIAITNKVYLMAQRYNEHGVWLLDAPGFSTAMRWAKLAAAAAYRENCPCVAELIESMWSLSVDTIREYS